MTATPPAPGDVISQALASMDSAVASLTVRDCEAALDDVLAARLLLNTLLVWFADGDDAADRP